MDLSTPVLAVPTPADADDPQRSSVLGHPAEATDREACDVCPHPRAGHDAIALRFCSATGDGAMARGCACRS